ncbi:hypothetical protein [Acidaminococcus massiliensis]|uniref:hypothetical protein n=1 Tax=Acidaminococcus massiliensis TaxID=1852375 RepID=UPI0022E73911|nr:hypothetical protein [Acidaminococcus massiliensis]
MKAKKLRLLLLALCFCLFWLPSTCFGSRVLTEEQYQRLLSISQRQEEISETLNNELNLSEEQLTKQQNELTACRNELAKVKESLEKSKSQSEELKASLKKAEDSQKKAEESLKAYQKLMESKLATAKRQRNFWSIVAATSAVIAIYGMVN